MARKRLLWHLYPAFLAISLVALLAVSWYVSRALHQFHFEQAELDLRARAQLVAYQLRGHLAPVHGVWVDALSKELGQRTATRITVVLADGTVLGDSSEDPAQMDNHANRPEILDARMSGIGTAVRFSHTLGNNLMYVALKVEEDQRYLGCVRVAIPVDSLDKTLRGINLRIFAGGLIVALLAALVSLWISRRISQPLEEMKSGAERFARGELGRKLPVRGSEETQLLAEAMNTMASELDDRIRTVLNQRNEIEAVLASMVEGVLAVDNDERILRLNHAALTLLQVGNRDCVGRPIQEAIRKADLQRFVGRVLKEGGPMEEDLVLHGGVNRYLQAHGTLLRGADGRQIGALVVLNDVTRLRRLENLRRDFVANVSHELKTPITAIKGFVETLLDGAMHQPEDAKRFLEIVVRQTERLNAIIEDLLNLSRIEQEAESEGVELTTAEIESVLRSVVQGCSIVAGRRNVRLELSCATDLQARINPPLLEQAVTNLVDNAVKYSPEGGTVTLVGERSGEELVIHVTDRGCGIAAEHLPRLFERFYRVDKARSRKLGGTGLGLAIVKHIVQAHHGRVEVESTPGRGSSFSIYLPGR